MAASRSGQDRHAARGINPPSCAPAGGGIVPPLGEASTPQRDLAGAASGPRSADAAGPLPRPAAARPVTREVVAGRAPLPGAIPFSRGDRVRAHIRPGVWVVTRIKTIVWSTNGWAASCISAGIVPIGQLDRREGKDVLTVERQISNVETALAELAANPLLTAPQRSAVRGCISAIKGVGTVRRETMLRAVLGGRPIHAALAADCRQRQLPVGDRDDGGCDDAA